jgi:hypothetical protein
MTVPATIVRATPLAAAPITWPTIGRMSKPLKAGITNWRICAPTTPPIAPATKFRAGPKYAIPLCLRFLLVMLKRGPRWRIKRFASDARSILPRLDAAFRKARLSAVGFAYSLNIAELCCLGDRADHRLGPPLATFAYHSPWASPPAPGRDV